MEIEIENLNAKQNLLIGILKKINNRKTKKNFDAENNFLFLDIDTLKKDKFRGHEIILIKERLRRKLEKKKIE